MFAICDDELLHARQTQAAIRRCEAQAVTRCFETPLALLAAVTQQGYAPRVAVLDIRMAGMDGIELAKRLNALVPGCAVIFLTAYLSYAPDVYETRHVYFVLKSELDRRIGSALRAALAETAAPASLQLATAHGYRNVPVTDVLFLTEARSWSPPRPPPCWKPCRTVSSCAATRATGRIFRTSPPWRRTSSS